MSLTQLDQTESPVQKICQKCGSQFEAQASFARFALHCSSCASKLEQERERARAAQARIAREARWQEICPCDFLDTKPHRLPDQATYHEVMSWRYGKTGLLLVGPTGTGKSRTAWSLAKREFDAGLSVLALNAMAGMQYAAAYAESIRDALQWTHRHARTDLLLLDDVFKAKLTDSFEAALFAIVCERTERHKPCLITSNDTGASLAQRFSLDRGEPFIRRLREYCQTIVFDFTPINPAS